MSWSDSTQPTHFSTCNPDSGFFPPCRRSLLSLFLSFSLSLFLSLSLSLSLSFSLSLSLGFHLHLQEPRFSMPGSRVPDSSRRIVKRGINLVACQSPTLWRHRMRGGEQTNVCDHAGGELQFQHLHTRTGQKNCALVANDRDTQFFSWVRGRTPPLDPPEAGRCLTLQWRSTFCLSLRQGSPRTVGSFSIRMQTTLINKLRGLTLSANSIAASAFEDLISSVAGVLNISPSTLQVGWSDGMAESFLTRSIGEVRESELCSQGCSKYPTSR